MEDAVTQTIALLCTKHQNHMEQLVYFFPGEPTFLRRVLFFFQKIDRYST
jgi:hypothetical protein